MSELTITQIIKTIIAVFVIVVVVLGVYLTFNNYIFPMFGLEEEENPNIPDLPAETLKDIVKEGNKIGHTTAAGPKVVDRRLYLSIGNLALIYIKEGEGVRKLMIYIDAAWYDISSWTDKQIGRVYYKENYAIITIDPEIIKKYPKFKVLDNAVIFEDKVYKNA